MLLWQMGLFLPRYIITRLTIGLDVYQLLWLIGVKYQLLSVILCLDFYLVCYVIKTEICCRDLGNLYKMSDFFYVQALLFLVEKLISILTYPLKIQLEI